MAISFNLLLEATWQTIYMVTIALFFRKYHWYDFRNHVSRDEKRAYIRE